MENNYRSRFVSLRNKIWLGFVLVSVPIFVVSYYWLSQFAYASVLHQISDQLVDTIRGALQGMDVEGFKQLYLEESTGNPNCPPSSEAEQNGYYPENNPLYLAHVSWLQTVQNIAPTTRIYTYVKGPKPGDVIGIGSTGYYFEPRQGFKFCELYNSHGKTQISEGLIHRVDHWTVYSDKFGSWITTYMPIQDENGQIVGAIGVDISAEHLIGIKNRVLLGTALIVVISYIIIFALVFWLAGFLTHPIIVLADIAQEVGDGNYELDLATLKRKVRFRDEIDTLTNVFLKMVASVIERNRQLRELTQKVILSQEAERRQVSHELYDEAAQVLVSMKYELDTILSELPPGEIYVRERISSAIDQLDKTMNQIRDLAYSLRPALLDIANLDLALQDYCQEFGERTGLSVEYRGCEVSDLSEEASLSFFRFLQESLTNAAKHTGASKILVNLSNDGDRLVLSIRDDGNGNVIDSTGYLGMKERFKMLNGQVEVSTQNQTGFVITAGIPWESNT